MPSETVRQPGSADALARAADALILAAAQVMGGYSPWLPSPEPRRTC